MIRFDYTEVHGWEPAICGMRNPMNSWVNSDTVFEWCWDYEYSRVLENPKIGPNDLALMQKLAKAGTDHRKFLRMIIVYVNITAPLYWWKEFDTYKVGTVANSCSTMHKIHDRDLTLEDFSTEKLFTENLLHLEDTIDILNRNRREFKDCQLKCYWEQMIQLLPTSYNQKRTVMLNYEVLSNIYKSRKNHKLDEWRELCRWIETLPYSGLITGKEGEADGKPEDHQGDCEANSGGIPVLPEQ